MIRRLLCIILGHQWLFSQWVARSEKIVWLCYRCHKLEIIGYDGKTAITTRP